MAGCSKKQYAIMMNGGDEGQSLASKMGGMSQEEFNKAFSEFLKSDAAVEASTGYKPEEDEDLQEFDKTDDRDIGFDDEYLNYDRSEKIANDINEYATDKELSQLKRYTDKYEIDFEDAKTELAKRFDKYQKDGGLSQRDAMRAAIDALTDDIVMGEYGKEPEPNPMDEFSGPDKNGPSYAELDAMDKKYNKLSESIKNAKSLEEIEEISKQLAVAKELGDINKDKYDELDEALYNREHEIDELNNNSEYKAPHNYEDYEGARFYPVTDEDKKAAGPRYLGRYHSIYDAHGLSDKDPDSWKKERDMFEYVGNSENGSNIVRGPDGYYSGNPRINSMSFKTQEEAANWLDRKNPEEHKYGVYFEPGSERESVYRDAEDKYDLEAPDAYRNAREAVKKQEVGQKIGKLGHKEMKLSEAIDLVKTAPDNIKEILGSVVASNFGLSENEVNEMLGKVDRPSSGSINKPETKIFNAMNPDISEEDFKRSLTTSAKRLGRGLSQNRQEEYDSIKNDLRKVRQSYEADVDNYIKEGKDPSEVHKYYYKHFANHVLPILQGNVSKEDRPILDKMFVEFKKQLSDKLDSVKIGK